MDQNPTFKVLQHEPNVIKDQPVLHEMPRSQTYYIESINLPSSLKKMQHKFETLLLSLSNVKSLYFESQLKYYDQLKSNLVFFLNFFTMIQNSDTDLLTIRAFLKNDSILFFDIKSQCFKVFVKYFENEVLNQLQDYLNDLEQRSKIKKWFAKLKYFKIKLQRIIHNNIESLIFKYLHLVELQSYLPSIIQQTEEDLFYAGQYSPRFLKLKESSIMIEVQEDQFKKSLSKLQGNLQFLYGLQLRANKNNNYINKIFSYGINGVKFYVSQKRAEQNFHYYYSDISQDSILQISKNAEESQIMKQSLKLFLEPIFFNRKIYIDYNVVENIKLKDIYEDIKNEKIGLFKEKELERMSCDNQNMYVKSQNKIKIRVLYFQDFFNKTMDGQENKVIIHIHGGGFIGMSSRSHQTYTRQWANKLKTIVFSIDYGLAPENPYPAGLNDCWQAYNWILIYCEEFFKIKPDNVVLVGDSAGGNLVIGITVHAIRTRGRVPDGILVCYPALNLDLNRFTPSFLIGIKDFILPYNFLKCCCLFYCQQKDENDQKMVLPDKDPYISPLLISDEILKRFPRVEILAGTQDPLYDDQWRFLELLKNNNVKSTLKYYVNFPHGFMNLDSVFDVSKMCITDSIYLIEQLLYEKYQYTENQT